MRAKYLLGRFNNYQFNTKLCIENQPLEQVKVERLLGVVINDKLTWESYTQFLIKESYTKIIILHNLFKFGLPLKDMMEIYILYIRSVVENSAVVRHSSLTVAGHLTIECVQKVALKIILNENYESYDQALEVSGLQTMKEEFSSRNLQLRG